MSNEQKLREALQAISHIDDTTNHSVDASAALDRIGQIARQALALPTADHLPDARKMVVDHFPDATKMIETAAPVGEREAFEREMSKPPFEFCMDRWPDDGSYAWPGNYAAYHTQCAWAAWQARAALSAQAVESPCACWPGRMCSRPSECAQAVPQDEPVAWLDLSKMSASAMVYATGWKSNDKQSPLYTTPAAPSRPVTLTDDDIARCINVATCGRPFIGLMNSGGVPSAFSRSLADLLIAALRAKGGK